MDHRAVTAMVTALAPVIHEHVTKGIADAVAPLLKRISELEARSPEKGEPGERGADGAPGRDGVDGKDGADGLGFDDLSVEHDGERTLTLRFVRGEQSKEFAVDLPIVIDRGVWREGKFKRGDGVSWGGSFFIAQKNTTAKPETSADWRLAVKRGRDGKDGKPGEKGQQGDKGDRGEPGPRGYGG